MEISNKCPRYQFDLFDTPYDPQSGVREDRECTCGTCPAIRRFNGLIEIADRLYPRGYRMNLAGQPIW